MDKEINDKDKNKEFSKWIVITSLGLIIAYTVVSFYFAWHDKIVPAELTLSFFGAIAVELSALAGIKIKEVVCQYAANKQFPSSPNQWQNHDHVVGKDKIKG